jgi:hypothetical protein
MNKNPTPSARASDWQSYLCKVNDELASIYVDLGFASTAPLPETPKLVWLWIRLNHPREDGLSSDEEFDALCNFEDGLEGTVNNHKPSYYVGRITTQGRREFYFYTTHAMEFQKVADNWMELHSEYSFQHGAKTDELWNHYFKTLLPGASGLEQIRKRASKK